MLKLKKVFRLTPEGDGIERIDFSKLRSGDIFYCEDDNFDLDVDEQGRFLELAFTDAKPSTTENGNYIIEVEYIA